MPVNDNSKCLCCDCLAQNLQLQLKQLLDTHSKEEAVRKLASFRNDPLLEGIDYVVENGLWIFSTWYLLRRGYCCQQGCSRCPY